MHGRLGDPGTPRDTHIRLSDGRILVSTEIGDPDGYPVLFFHGAPGSRLGLVPWASLFTERALRIVCLDRPAYGGSSPKSGRKLTDWPTDVAEVADALEISSFIAAGHSSGGPYALSCAALLPDRVSGLVIVAGVTDMGWPDAWQGFSELEGALMRLADERTILERCVELFGEDGSRFFDAPGVDLSEPDLAFLADATIGQAVGDSMAEAFRQGVQGYAQDVFVQGHPWTFSLGAKAIPSIVLHGSEDTIVPVSHSEHTAGQLDGATLRVLSGHGHITILSELADVIGELVGRDAVFSSRHF